MIAFLQLFFEFLKIGLFSIGGGLATLPFLYQLAERYDWFTKAMIADMIAVSESTPGPLGINMATYTGFQNMGPLGSLAATIGLILPSLIIIIWISKFLEKFRSNPYVESVFYTIRPTVTGLVGVAGFRVIIQSLFGAEKIGEIFLHSIQVKECILFAVMLFLTNKYNRHPVFYIACGAVIGILFQF